MAIKIVVSDIVGIKVKGAINDAAGIPQSFDFGLTCTRLDGDQIVDRLKSDPDSNILTFFQGLVQGWSGVRDEDDKPLTYSEDGLRQLFKIPGVANLAFRTYMQEVGAKEKN